MKSKTLGNIGEQVATKYLQDKGYKIICNNFTNKIGEIDIICKRDDYTIFVEVKNRFTYQFGRPMFAVDKRKQHKIRMVALAYMQKQKLLDDNVRFDVVEVNENEVINHIENAF